MQRVLQSAWQAPRWRVCLPPTITATSSTRVNVRSCLSPAFLPHRLFGWSRPPPNLGTSKQILPVSSAFRPVVTAGPSDHMHTNRLAKEESPYLLQHQHNPVRVILNVFRCHVTCVNYGREPCAQYECCALCYSCPTPRWTGTLGRQRPLTKPFKRTSQFFYQ